MALTHDVRMLDRPWLARHAMKRHGIDFEKFRLTHLRSFDVKRLLAEARALRDAGKDATEAVRKLEEAKSHGDVDAVVTLATHERLNKRPSPQAVDEAYVMRAMRDDRIRRDLLMVFRQQTRAVSYGAIVMALVIAWAGLGWAIRNTDSLRASYQAAILDYQNAQPKSLRQKAQDLVGGARGFAADKRAQFDQKVEEHRARNDVKEEDLIDQIRRKRGE